MNLHAVASAAISSINPMSQVGILVSTGSTDNDDGSRTPTYNPLRIVSAQLQSLQYSDVMKLEGLNIQNVRDKIYLSGDLEGLIRVDRRGGWENLRRGDHSGELARVDLCGDHTTDRPAQVYGVR